MSINWKQLIALGLCSVGEYTERKEPVAYLYGGVRLPPLPEWDKEAAPYAFIDTSDPTSTSTTGGNYAIYMHSKASVVGSDNWLKFSKPVYQALKWTGWGVVKKLTNTNAIKVKPDYDGDSYLHIIWTNHDIYNEDGTLHLAASEPIPIYE